jgi:hypothetical protein
MIDFINETDPFVGTDCWGRCKRCGEYVPYTGGCMRCESERSVVVTKIILLPHEEKKEKIGSVTWAKH